MKPSPTSIIQNHISLMRTGWVAQDYFRFLISVIMTDRNYIPIPVAPSSQRRTPSCSSSHLHNSTPSTNYSHYPPTTTPVTTLNYARGSSCGCGGKKSPGGGKARQSLNKSCEFCGFNHSPSVGGRNSNSDPKPSSSGCGKKGGGGTDKPSGSGSGSGNGGGGKDPGGGGDAGGGGDSSGGGGTDPDPDPDPDAGGGDGRPPGGHMNGDDPDICPDCLSNGLFWMTVAAIVLGGFGLYYCSGSDSIGDCLSVGFDRGCNMNKNLAGFFNKSGGGGGCCGGGDTGKVSGESISSHLQEQYDAFIKASKNPECLHKYSERCPGLVNYAGALAGASIVTTRETQNFPNPMLCRCQDEGKFGKVCDPSGDGDCSSCKCEQIGAEILIQEEGKLVAGRCWAFMGEGKVLISLFFPLIITGVSVHHPSKSHLLPGFFSSAPKDFEVWGYENPEDEKTHFFGAFEYTGKDSPTEIYEVKNNSKTPYAQVQFNFLTNHGN